MNIYEISGYQTGISKEGVNFLQPSDSFEEIEDGYVFRQVLKSRKGFSRFSTGQLDGVISDKTRVMGIFEHVVAYTTTELLAITQKALYKYNEGTDTFDQIPMAGLAPAAGFGITSNSHYVSGTTYPFKDGSNRFVFCGKGLAQIYMYDGTDVKLFNNVADNPDYQAPASGTLTKADHAIWFGERLNLFNPTIGGTKNPQGVLYSAIRNSAGNGDKFSTAGAGLLNADTYQYINGARILGDKMIMNFTRSSYVLEKTRDPFNPYFVRKVPSELGTDAAFSPVNWEDINISIGKTGVLSTDGVSSTRIDTKIPAFIEDELDPEEIQLTYGGFERINTQLMFSYKSQDDSDGTTQDKVLISNYNEGSWAIFNQRFSCFGQTDKGPLIPWNKIDESDHPEFPDWSRWDTTTDTWNKIGLEATVQKTLAGDDNGFIWSLYRDTDDYSHAITSATSANPSVVTIGTHSFEVGDEVYIMGVEGMADDEGLIGINNFNPVNPDYNAKPWTITAIGATTITIDYDAEDDTAYTGEGLVSMPISFKAKTIPFNPYRDQGRTCYISHVEFLLNTGGSFLETSIYQDEEETPFKKDVLLRPTSTLKDREWISMSVNNEANFMTFEFKQMTPAFQMELYSMRIHCMPGGLSSG
jgi:hypothetical protein